MHNMRFEKIDRLLQPLNHFIAHESFRRSAAVRVRPRRVGVGELAFQCPNAIKLVYICVIGQ